jgi:hypothetical protein
MTPADAEMNEQVNFTYIRSFNDSDINLYFTNKIKNIFFTFLLILHLRYLLSVILFKTWTAVITIPKKIGFLKHYIHALIFSEYKSEKFKLLVFIWIFMNVFSGGAFSIIVENHLDSIF